MRSRFTVLAVAAASALALSTTGTTATAADSTGDSPTGHYIVVLDDGALSRTVAAAHADRFGFELGHVYTSALEGYSATMTAETAALVEALPGVDWVQTDAPVAATAQTTPTGINRADADLSPTAAINGVDQRVNVDVAVIDTGVDLDHPDLNVYRAGARNCSTLGLSRRRRPRPRLARRRHHRRARQHQRRRRVAPGARIWPVKVLNALGTGLNSDVICGIDYVTAHAAEIEVANMSLGGGGEDDGNCGATNDDAMHAVDLRGRRQRHHLRGRRRQRLGRRLDVHPRGVRRGRHRERAGRLQRPARRRRAVDLPRRRGRHASRRSPTTAPTSTSSLRASASTAPR